MVKFIVLVLLSLSLSMPQSSLAQTNPNDPPMGAAGPRKQLATIIFAGLAGAILGLSTLSFYGRPQDKLQNIAVGFGVGIIGGTIFTTYQVATKPYSFEEQAQFLNQEHLNKSPVGLGFSWDF